MTLDINEHMEDKRRERFMVSYDTIGQAVDGMTVVAALQVLAAFTTTVLDSMEEPARVQLAMAFSNVIMKRGNQPEETVQ